MRTEPGNASAPPRSRLRLLAARALLAAAGVAAAPIAIAEGAPTLSLRSLAATCAQCHGTEGRAVEGSLLAPLAGMTEARFRERMAAFKAGSDAAATLMPQLAKGFSDDQIAQLGAYFAARPR